MPKTNSAAKAEHEERAVDGQPSGLDVGRLILRDLAKAYENMGQGLLTDQERLELVENLRSPEEIHQFNQFRYLHEYLTRANLAAAVYKQTASACFWQIKYYLELLRNQATQSDQPRSLCLPAKKQCKNQRKKIDPLFQENSEEIKNLPRTIVEYKQAVREMLVIETAVEIISRFVEVPEIRGLVGRLDLEEFKALNLALSLAAGLSFDSGDSEVDAELKAALTPLELAALTPSESARHKARQAFDFSTVQGHIEAFYHLLRL